MNGTEKTIEVLNDLIMINNDRCTGYENAANDVEPDELTMKGLFYQLAEESRECKEQLSQKVRELGGVPANDNHTLRGKIYHAWMNLRVKFSGDSTLAILESCEFG